MSWYDQVDLEDFVWDKKLEVFHHPCPCGDRFEITLEQLLGGKTDVAVCPSCGLSVQVLFQRNELSSLAQTVKPEMIVA